MPVLTSAWARGLRDTHSSSLNDYEGFFIAHHFWREIADNGLSEAHYQTENTAKHLAVHIGWCLSQTDVYLKFNMEKLLSFVALCCACLKTQIPLILCSSSLTCNHSPLEASSWLPWPVQRGPGYAKTKTQTQE